AIVGQSIADRHRDGARALVVVNRVDAISAPHDVAAVWRGLGDEAVVAGAAVQTVALGAAVESVVAVSPVQPVATVIPYEPIVAIAAPQVEATAERSAGVARSVDDVISRAAVDDQELGSVGRDVLVEIAPDVEPG